MKVVHVLLSADRSYGGPPIVVRDLTKALVELGVECSIITTSQRHSQTVEFPHGVSVRLCDHPVGLRIGIPLTPSILTALREETESADLVHIHDLWHFPQLAAAISSRLREIPYVVSPHGALEPWCLKQRRILKLAAWCFYQKRILNGASTVHALSVEEERTARKLRLTSRTSVISSGVDLDALDRLRRERTSIITPRDDWQPPFVLYLGRLDPKKQLAVLIDSFSIIASVDKVTSLVIAGPDPSGLWQQLQRRVDDLGLSHRIRYLGFVDDVAKLRLMSEAELFVQPSHTEGLSVAVLEAMACGTPVVLSPGCQVPGVAEFSAGMIVNDTPVDIAKAIQKVLTDSDLRNSMGNNARRLIEERLTARRMASAMKNLYLTSLNVKSLPDGVVR